MLVCTCMIFYASLNGINDNLSQQEYFMCILCKRDIFEPNIHFEFQEDLNCVVEFKNVSTIFFSLNFYNFQQLHQFFI